MFVFIHKLFTVNNKDINHKLINNQIFKSLRNEKDLNLKNKALL